MARLMVRLCLVRALVGGKYASKPSLMNIRSVFVVPVTWLARSFNSRRDSTHSRVSR